jgi:nicotinamidase/pyrazinamidase
MAPMPPRTVFWDVDTQLDFMLPPGKLHVPGAEELLANLGRLTATARALSIPIVHTADDHDLVDPEIAVEGADFVDTFPPHCLRGTAGVERVPETKPGPGTVEIAWDGSGLDLEAVRSAPEILLQKKRFDVFSNPATGPVLGALAPERVVVYGVALDVCDRYAVEGMLGLGNGGDGGGPPFEIVVVEDAVAAIDPARGAELLADWRGRGVQVMATTEVLAACGLGARGDPPEWQPARPETS